MTLNELAQLLTVKAKGDTYKATAPNPKAEILSTIDCPTHLSWEPPTVTKLCSGATRY
jgi:hypothetical protein